MKTKLFPFALLVLVLICSSAFSQSEGEKIRFHMAPLNLFDPITGVLQVGIQKNLHQRFALSLDHGVQMQTFRYLIADNGSDRKHYNYSKTKAELKYLMDVKDREHRPGAFSYLSVEGMYFPQKYVKEDEFLYRNRTSYRYAYSYIKRPVWVASLKYGIEVRYSKFVIDSFFGLGVRRLSITHKPFGLAEEEYYGPADLDFQPIDRKEGVFYRPHVSLGARLGYIIR